MAAKQEKVKVPNIMSYLNTIYVVANNSIAAIIYQAKIHISTYISVN